MTTPTHIPNEVSQFVEIKLDQVPEAIDILKIEINEDQRRRLYKQIDTIKHNLQDERMIIWVNVKQSFRRRNDMFWPCIEWNKALLRGKGYIDITVEATKTGKFIVEYLGYLENRRIICVEGDNVYNYSENHEPLLYYNEFTNIEKYKCYEKFYKIGILLLQASINFVKNELNDYYDSPSMITSFKNILTSNNTENNDRNHDNNSRLNINKNKNIKSNNTNDGLCKIEKPKKRKRIEIEMFTSESSDDENNSEDINTLMNSFSLHKTAGLSDDMLDSIDSPYIDIMDDLITGNGSHKISSSASTPSSTSFTPLFASSKEITTVRTKDTFSSPSSSSSITSITPSPPSSIHTPVAAEINTSNDNNNQITSDGNCNSKDNNIISFNDGCSSSPHYVDYERVDDDLVTATQIIYDDNDDYDIYNNNNENISDSKSKKEEMQDDDDGFVDNSPEIKDTSGMIRVIQSISNNNNNNNNNNTSEDRNDNNNDKVAFNLKSLENDDNNINIIKKRNSVLIDDDNDNNINTNITTNSNINTNKNNENNNVITNTSNKSVRRSFSMFSRNRIKKSSKTTDNNNSSEVNDSSKSMKRRISFFRRSDSKKPRVETEIIPETVAIDKIVDISEGSDSE